MHVMRLRRGYRCFFPSLAFLLVFSATAFAFAFLHKNESVKPQTESKQMNVYHFMKLVHSANGPVRIL
ncbi:hypothetical protein OESDEN_14075 [Oesophagostomum dentatum]|uniref:Uncharacterized protein n=1 Tax=Oesophagostomum dentatum TaxID=61180 RepID=A0A0B1SLL0_OESDE|nr:hypothetical protein OESDEN_14075 [Oesophagostomum dentatum]